MRLVKKEENNIMKKLLILILGVLLSLCACSEKEKIDLSNEEIEYMSIRYHTTNDKEVYCSVIVDFQEEQILLKWKNLDDDTEKEFKVFYAEKVKSLIKESIKKENDDRENNDGKSYDEQKILWSISVRTDKNRYNFSDFDNYPTYWDELWEMFIETTEAENLSDFGFLEEEISMTQ